MKNTYLLLFLLLLSCQQKKQKKNQVNEFNFKVVELKFSDPLPSGPYLISYYENNKLRNGDIYRAKVVLKNHTFPTGYSDSTVIKFLPDSASVDEVFAKGINAVVKNDTGYVKFEVFQPNLKRGDSVVKQMVAVIINPSLPEFPQYTVNYEYTIYGK